MLLDQADQNLRLKEKFLCLKKFKNLQQKGNPKVH